MGQLPPPSVSAPPYDALDEPLAGQVVGGSLRATDSTTTDSTTTTTYCYGYYYCWLVERSRGRRGVPCIPARPRRQMVESWAAPVSAAATTVATPMMRCRPSRIALPSFWPPPPPPYDDDDDPPDAMPAIQDSSPECLAASAAAVRRR